MPVIQRKVEEKTGFTVLFTEQKYKVNLIIFWDWNEIVGKGKKENTIQDILELKHNRAF